MLRNLVEDLGRAVLRTVVPFVVGGLVTVLTALEVPLPPGYEEAATAVTTVAVGGLFYGLVRAAGQRWPQAEWLLGTPTPPTYEGWHTDEVQAAVVYALSLEPDDHGDERQQLLQRLGVSERDARRIIGLEE